jgi:hypothetical protein
VLCEAPLGIDPSMIICLQQVGRKARL